MDRYLIDLIDRYGLSGMIQLYKQALRTFPYNLAALKYQFTHQQAAKEHMFILRPLVRPINSAETVYPPNADEAPLYLRWRTSPKTCQGDELNVAITYLSRNPINVGLFIKNERLP